MNYIGIDPGSASGYIAVITDTGYERFAFKNTTLREMYVFLLKYSTFSYCVLEKVWGIPGMSVKAVSSFILNKGHIEAMLTATLTPWRDETPMTWMKFYGMKKQKEETKTAWKNRLKDLAERRMPLAPITMENADAFLIALYCKETYNK